MKSVKKILRNIIGSAFGESTPLQNCQRPPSWELPWIAECVKYHESNLLHPAGVRPKVLRTNV